MHRETSEPYFQSLVRSAGAPVELRSSTGGNSIGRTRSSLHPRSSPSRTSVGQDTKSEPCSKGGHPNTRSPNPYPRIPHPHNPVFSKITPSIRGHQNPPPSKQGSKYQNPRFPPYTKKQHMVKSLENEVTQESCILPIFRKIPKTEKSEKTEKYHFSEKHRFFKKPVFSEKPLFSHI